MPEQSGLIEIVEFMSGAIEKGQKFWEFFGPQQPTAETITAAFAAEVQQIFTTGTAQGDVTKAQSDLDAAQHFLANGGDYANAVKNGETNAQLIGHMDGTDGPPLFALNSHADTMNGWVQNPGLVGWDVINKAATLYLALQTYLCTIHRERARISDDEKEKKTQLDDATSAARTAFATMKGVLLNIMVSRCQSLSVGQWSYTTQSGRHPAYEAGSILSDGWLHGGGDYTLRTRARKDGPYDDQIATIQGLIGPYQNLLWHGGDKAQAALVAALDSAALDSGSADSFKNADLPKVRAFGDWAASVRASLLALDGIGRWHGQAGQLALVQWLRHVVLPAGAGLQAVPDLWCLPSRRRRRAQLQLSGPSRQDGRPQYRGRLDLVQQVRRAAPRKRRRRPVSGDERPAFG